MSVTPTLVWFRQDLRVRDNPALAAACRAGPVVCVYILDDEDAGRWKRGAASRWWLHHSLAALETSLRARGGALILRRGAAEREIPALAAETGARALYWNRCYEPWRVARDTRLKERLKAEGLEAKSFNAGQLIEPWEIKPYKVFTPYYRAVVAAHDFPPPAPAPTRVTAPAVLPASLPLAALQLLPRLPWASEFAHHWTPGEEGALAALKAFGPKAKDYARGRDVPGEEGVSRLSPHLHFGEISPRAVWHGAAEGPFRRQLIWREFSTHLLHHAPRMPEENWNPRFPALPWRNNENEIAAWQKGQTGYPFIDAGMRQLWRTGWMHNRARMATGSFLIKHLLADWRIGQDWFWDTLVDADLANNAAGWQWVAGSGADASPYIRVFNPILQGQKFDPAGDYIRAFVPELKDVPDAFIHTPWTMPKPPKDYPPPLVDHPAARARALAAHAQSRGGSQ